MSITKVCSKCRAKKQADLFRKRSELKGGLSSWCKSCHKAHRETRRAVEKANNKKWYQENKEHAKALSKNYKKKNRDIISAKDRERYSNDIQFKLKQLLRSRVRSYIKGATKVVDDNLGCSIEELKKHLENQFQEGMSWDNHGTYGWHIDHIKPLASFDLTKEEDLQKACHYTNLQPLWAKDNLSKGTNIE